jgi:LAO/AO transport system kinase
MTRKLLRSLPTPTLGLCPRMTSQGLVYQQIPSLQPFQCRRAIIPPFSSFRMHTNYNIPSQERSSPISMEPSTQHLLDGILSQDPQTQRFSLSRAITLIESKLPRHQDQANSLLEHILTLGNENSSSSSTNTTQPQKLRLGIAGPPGAGKSTLIEMFGTWILNQKLLSKLAVVCVDPSSTVTGGSILGDKTRMIQLSSRHDAFVRPSSNGTNLGGLAAYTDDVVSLFQAANYEWVIVETVGLGQSEVEISQSVDIMVLVLPPASGDELQGIKKGILEVADLIVVNKADGSLLSAARRTAADYQQAARSSSSSSSSSSRPPVMLISSHTQTGFQELWDQIQSQCHSKIQSGQWAQRRQVQAKYWMWKHWQRMLTEETQQNPTLKRTAERLMQDLNNGTCTPRLAARHLLRRCIIHT